MSLHGALAASGPQPLVVVVREAPSPRSDVTADPGARGYEVRVASASTDALRALAGILPALVMLEIDMPDGLPVLEALHREIDVPVLMLPARGREGDAVRAPDLGGDDGLARPIRIEELLARVRAAVRRASIASHERQLGSYRHDALEIDYGSRRVRAAGRDIRLTRLEYDLLAHLSRNAGRVLTHRQILEAVWGPEYGEEADYVWAYVRRVRRKIEPDPAHPRYLITEVGVGYRMREPEQRRD